MNRISLYAALLAVSLTVPAAMAAAPTIQAGFSPEGSCATAGVKHARLSIRLMGYSFTSPKVVKALMDAKWLTGSHGWSWEQTECLHTDFHEN